MSNANAGQKKPKKKSAGKKAQKVSRADFVDQVRPKNAFKLSSCGEKYLDSLLDPFEGPGDACVPNWPSFPSQKQRSFVRGSVTIGTAGLGFVLVRPTAANDSTVGVYTGPTFAGSTLTSTTGSGVTALLTNSQYASASFGAAAAQQRMVSCGLRVRYSGTELNRGGTIMTLEQPDHQDLSGLNIFQLRQYDACHTFRPDQDWTQVCWLPTNATEVDYYAGALAPNPNGQSDNLSYCLVIALIGSSGNTFDFELSLNHEIIGSNIRTKTPSDTDTVGLGVVTGALRSHNQGVVDRKVITLRDKHPNKGGTQPSLLKAIGSYAWKQLSGFITDPAKMAGAAGLVASIL